MPLPKTGSDSTTFTPVAFFFDANCLIVNSSSTTTQSVTIGNIGTQLFDLILCRHRQLHH